jgi:hypothetical protein
MRRRFVLIALIQLRQPRITGEPKFRERLHQGDLLDARGDAGMRTINGHPRLRLPLLTAN